MQHYEKDWPPPSIADLSRIDHSLISALIERRRLETNTFHFLSGEATITLEDVAYIYGLPINGPPVIGRTYTKRPIIEEVCNTLLGKVPKPTDIEGGQLKHIWFHKNFVEPLENASEDDIDRYTRAYLFCLVSTQIFGFTSGSRGLAYVLELFETFQVYAWASACLANLYKTLSKATRVKDGIKTICGALQLLQRDEKSSNVTVDYRVKLKQQVEAWQNRVSLVIDGEYDELVGRHPHEYFAWYHRITRLRVGWPPPARRNPQYEHAVQQMKIFLKHVAATVDSVDEKYDSWFLYKIMQTIQQQCLKFLAACSAGFENFNLEECINSMSYENFNEIEAGCQAYTHEMPVVKRQIIDGRTQAKSDTHVRRRPQKGQAPVQADDAETDSIEDMLLAIEHAVYDQSVQIEQLEERVATSILEIGRRHFKHQILLESNKNCKILQSSQKKGTHGVSGHFDVIWPNFTPPTARQELPAATVSKTSKLRSEPTDGLRIPPKAPLPNFKSNGQRLTLHQLSGSKKRPTGSGAPRNHGIQIGANGSSQNDSNRSPVKF
ncbi:serine/threonine-protein phosphatase 7 long form [Cinnamomum micranthum f. kanehirae]|uniref:Serine/threonine-protein phosphatase 7 long form n=1 Tax=Cinnamomum micranthum f. kanehirae TaxID=337451 RepID=A0A443P2A4_9MAGN|nr:serine/threonine-protein phosphatase 7 long form [Cinnamomum micranthum f. kanehirae]